LHGGRLGEAQVLDRGDQLGRQAQLDEAVRQLRLGGGLDRVQSLELGCIVGNGSDSLITAETAKSSDCTGANSPCASKASVIQ